MEDALKQLNGGTEKFSYGGRNQSEAVIDLSEEKELASRIGNITGAGKYKIIQQYIIDKLGRNFTLSDGTEVVVDNKDAMHIANKSADKKTAEISAVDKVIRSAKLYAYDNNVQHGKFDAFGYYRAYVSFNGETYPIYLNIGQAKNDGSFHFYDITQKIKDTAHRINGVGRLREFLPISGISIKSISNKNENVKEKFSANSSGSDNGGKVSLEDALKQLNVAGGGELLYSKRYAKQLFPGGVFPKGDFYDAHKYATIWAHSEEVSAGDRALAYYNRNWYWIEAFDDSGYQVIEKIGNDWYKVEEAHYEKINAGQSVQKRIDWFDALDRGRNKNGKEGRYRRTSFDGNRGNDFSIRSMGEIKDEGRETNSNTASGSSGGGTNQSRTDRPSVKLKSRTVSAEQDAEYLANSSMTQEQAKRMIQLAFNANGIKQWYDNKYSNGDEWLIILYSYDKNSR